MENDQLMLTDKIMVKKVLACATEILGSFMIWFS